MMSKCPICNLGSGYTTCCGYDKITGKEVITIGKILKNLINKLKK